MRAVADEAQTTTRAVYSLFGSKDGLVAALAQTAFELLYDGIDELPETDDPGADLVAIGTQVVRRLVTDHPALYRIAFQRIAGLHPEPGLVAARERAWVQLQGRVSRLRDAGLRDDTGVADAARALNAMWEGLGNAELRGDVLRIMPSGHEERAWRAALTTVVRGLTSPRTLAAAADEGSRSGLPVEEDLGGRAVIRSGHVHASNAQICSRNQTVNSS